MKVKTSAPKEDPETEARRKVEEIRAEADRTAATQQMLDRRTRRVLRVFGKASGAGSSGSSGVVAPPDAISNIGRGGFGAVGGAPNPGFGAGGYGNPYGSIFY